MSENESAEKEVWARLTDDERETVRAAVYNVWMGTGDETSDAEVDAETERFVVPVIERIMTDRRAVRFACQTHACGSCAGCKAAKVRDLLTEATEREGRVRGLALWLRRRLADTSGWTTEDYDDACDHILRRLDRVYPPAENAEARP